MEVQHDLAPIRVDCSNGSCSDNPAERAVCTVFRQTQSSGKFALSRESADRRRDRHVGGLQFVRQFELPNLRSKKSAAGLACFGGNGNIALVPEKPAGKYYCRHGLLYAHNTNFLNIKVKK